MITIKQLQEWNNTKNMNLLEKQIELAIDEIIKNWVLQGKGLETMHFNKKTICSDFTECWFNGKVKLTSSSTRQISTILCRDCLIHVRARVLSEYRELGLIVKCIGEYSDTYDEGFTIDIPKELLEVDNE